MIINWLFCFQLLITRTICHDSNACKYFEKEAKRQLTVTIAIEPTNTDFVVPRWSKMRKGTFYYRSTNAHILLNEFLVRTEFIVLLLCTKIWNNSICELENGTIPQDVFDSWNSSMSSSGQHLEFTLVLTENLIWFLTHTKIRKTSFILKVDYLWKTKVK